MNETEHFFKKEELNKILHKCKKKTLGEIDVNNVFERTKTNPKITGIAGDVIEQSVLGYKPDTKQAPDLNVDGVKTELKTTGIRKSKKEKDKYEAKEPMTITAVSLDVIDRENFDNSAFWHKLEHLLLVYYLYDSDKTVEAAKYANFPFMGYEFYEFSDEDKNILKNDWQLVHDYVVTVKTNFEDPTKEYPKLSSGLREQLLFIDTAPKYPNPPRFRLKRSVVTNIIQGYFGGREKKQLEVLSESYSSESELKAKFHELTGKYASMTVDALAKELNITSSTNNKAISEQIIVRMFGGKSLKMQNIDLFNKIGLTAKSIVLTKSGLRTEDMKLFRIDFDEISNPELKFEESSFWDYFSNQFICIVFEEPSTEAAFGENKFIGFKKIVFDEDFLYEKVKPVWDKIRDLVINKKLVDVVSYDKNGNAIMNKTGTIKSAPNFPKSSEGVVFVRGDSSDSLNKSECVNGIRMYRQYLWIKGSFIAEILSKQLYM